MNKEQLYEILDITEGSEFTYFENLAELFETDEDYTSDLIYELLGEIDLDFFQEMCQTYFEQIEEGLPDSETDFYTLIENIKNVLIGLTESVIAEEESNDYDQLLLELSEETTRFHDWFIDDGLVAIVNNDTGDESKVSVRDACYQARAAKLTEESYSFDFTNALDYELSEYSMSFADLSGGDY